MAHVVDGADVGVAEVRDRLRLALEALAQVVVVHEVGGQDLDRHRALETRVPGLVHLSHAASPEGCDDLVRPEAGSFGEAHSVSWAGCSTIMMLRPAAARREPGPGGGPVGPEWGFPPRNPRTDLDRLR